eukprot:scaffold26293_cov112-Isochrysis_galbana.AAC.3
MRRHRLSRELVPLHALQSATEVAADPAQADHLHGKQHGQVGRADGSPSPSDGNCPLRIHQYRGSIARQKQVGAGSAARGTSIKRQAPYSKRMSCEASGSMSRCTMQTLVTITYASSGEGSGLPLTCAAEGRALCAASTSITPMGRRTATDKDAEMRPRQAKARRSSYMRFSQYSSYRRPLWSECPSACTCAKQAQAWSTKKDISNGSHTSARSSAWQAEMPPGPEAQALR